MSYKKQKSGSRLIANSFSSIGMEIGIDAAIRHSRFIKETIEEQQSKFEAEVQKRLEKIDEADPYYTENMDFIHDDLVNIKHVLPEIQWKSQFVFAMSLLEFTLNQICEAAAEEADIDIGYKDFSGQGVERCKLYLTRVFGISAFSGEEWEVLASLGKIRNIVVHANGELASKSDAIAPIAAVQRKIEGLSVLDYNDTEVVLKTPDDLPGTRVVLTAGFVLEALQRIKSFVGLLKQAQVAATSIAARPKS